jgi:hypothetical protein
MFHHHLPGRRSTLSLREMCKDCDALGKIMSGRETLSLKIEALRAIHMPQRIRRGSALMFLYLWSCNHVLQPLQWMAQASCKRYPRKKRQLSRFEEKKGILRKGE